MQAFEISELRRITSFHQRVEAGANQGTGSAAKHGLFAEQISFRFIAKCSFNYASASTTDRLGPGQRRPLGATTVVLLNGNQSRHSATIDEFASYHWSESFRRDHHNIDIFTRNDRAIINREAVSKEKRLACSQIRSDVLLIHGRHLGVRQSDKNDVAAPCCIGRLQNSETIPFRTNARFASAIETDHDPHSAIAQIERMGVPLRAKPDNGAGFPLQPRKIDIFIAINAHGHTSSSKLQLPAVPAPSQTAWPRALNA